MNHKGLHTNILVFVSLVMAPSWVLSQQQPPPSPVRYTEALEHPIRRDIRLPGTVEAKTSSSVASEVEGLVVRLVAHEGQAVRKGQALVELRKDHLELDLSAAEAELREAEARLKQAKQNLRRSQELFDSEVLSQGQLDEARYEFDAWTGRSEQLIADIARTKLDIERSTVRAPFAGIVVAERIDIGEWVGKGQPVVELMSLYELEVRVEVPEQHFRELNPGATATVGFEALPGYELNGRVSSIVPRANPQARTFPIKIKIENKEGRIGAGMLAQVSFPIGESYRATVVPKDAVITRGDRRFVYLISGEDTVDMIPVKTGAGIGQWIEVDGPVEPGAKVVTRGNERLRPGQKVRGEPLEYTLP
jgi:RND family efflux transporter MFP subunit